SHLVMPQPDLERWPAERIYDVRWAATVAERALRHLGEECEARGKRRVFDALSTCLTAERSDVCYATFAKTLGVPETTVKQLVHQLRERYRALLREEVLQTVDRPEDVDEELRYLCSALATATTES